MSQCVRCLPNPHNLNDDFYSQSSSVIQYGRILKSAFRIRHISVDGDWEFSSSHIYLYILLTASVQNQRENQNSVWNVINWAWDLGKRAVKATLNKTSHLQISSMRPASLWLVWLPWIWVCPSGRRSAAAEGSLENPGREGPHSGAHAWHSW